MPRIACQHAPGDAIRKYSRPAVYFSPGAVRAHYVDALPTSIAELGAAATMAQAQEVTMDFNSFVNLASTSFLHDPPAEFLALHAVLLRVASRPLDRATTTR
jgi:hypothetical protein